MPEFLDIHELFVHVDCISPDGPELLKEKTRSHGSSNPGTSVQCPVSQEVLLGLT